MFMKNGARFIFGLSATLALSACDLISDGGTTSTEVATITTPPQVNVTADNPPPGTPSNGDNTTQPPPPSQVVVEEGFLINEGATKTANATLNLHMFTIGSAKMKISATRDCSTGSWAPYSEFATVQAGALNQITYASVQFQDYDGGTSRCYRQSILHDGQGPTVLFTRYPAASNEEGTADQIIFEITDALGTVAGVQCKLEVISGTGGGLAPGRCVAGRNIVDISPMMVGDYKFTIDAQDDLGNFSTQSITWHVVSTTRKLTQNVNVDNYKKVDILMVIDNSGSMEYEQQSMASRVRNFLSVIRGLDYQIAVTTTDPDNKPLGDGRFIPIYGSNGQYILDTTTPEDVAQDRLGRTLQRPETGSSVEQGIRAVYRAVERYAANETAPRAFFRTGAQFAVVLISDEDESANTVKNDPQKLVDLVNTTFSSQKRFGFHSIITKPGDSQCRNTYGATYGDRYQRISQLTGGIVGSVCETDYAAQMVGIAQGVRDLLKTLTLQCVPLTQYGITVKKDGVAVTSAYRVDGVNLKFDAELEPGSYTIDYRCTK